MPLGEVTCLDRLHRMGVTSKNTIKKYHYRPEISADIP
ncbi:unnamed protein product [Gongylonema pulchrum]|uniref:Sigma54_DBD domain-containing protein n=1 Tax=Gongylonema pulchrum TaxID=637853 RepID=A0A183EV94_9BILA|nr:unnamed protein product [Gongylonema pulchrum]